MLSNDPTAGSARKFYRVFLLAASDINTFAGKVEKLLPQLEDAIDRLSQSYSGFIQMVDLDADEALESLLRLQSQIEVLLQNTKESKVGVNSFREASVGLAERKISNELSRASRRQAEALNGVISNVEKLEAFCVRALTMINQRLNATAQVTPRSVQN
jgi:hypothetical protein